MTDPATDKLVEQPMMTERGLTELLRCANETIVQRDAAIQRLTERAEKAEAERDRLRTALEKLLDAANRDPENHYDPSSDIYWAMKTARTALTCEVK